MILLDRVGVEFDPFFLFAVGDVLKTFVYVVFYPSGPLESVGVRGKQTVGSRYKEPDFMYLLSDALLMEGFFQFEGAPGTHKTSFRRFGLLVFHTGFTKGK